MEIDGHTPEGRNLTLASVGFFIFYAAGGYFDKNEVSLNVVNMHFQNYELMGYSAWAMIIWFAFRYWIESKSKVSSELLQNLPDYLLRSRLAREYVLRRAPPAPQGAHSWDVTKYRFLPEKPRGQRFRAVMFGVTVDGAGARRHVGQQDQVALTGTFGNLIVGLSAVAIALDRPLVTRLMIPWALFVLALVSAFYVTWIDPYPPPVFRE